jgi:hypothetical protein
MSENTNPQGSVQTVSDAANAFLSLMDSAEEKATQAQSESVEPKTSEEVEYEASDEDYQDESAEETVEPEEDTQPTKTFRVKVGNEEVEVTEEELLSGYSRTADYTKKTQALAETRKAVEAEKAAIEEAKQLRQTYAERLQAIEQILTKDTGEENLQELKDTDPIGYAIKVAERTEKEKQLMAVKAEQQRIAMQQQAEQQQAIQAHLAQAQTQLKQMIPDFADEVKAEVLKKDIRSYAKSVGWTDEDIAQIIDPRAVKSLYDGMMYQKLVANKGAATKKVQNAPKVIKSGTSTPRDSESEAIKKQFQQLRKTGKKADAAKLFEKFI